MPCRGGLSPSIFTVNQSRSIIRSESEMLRGTSRAGVAQAFEGQFMLLKHEAIWQHLLESARAPWNVVESIALVAQEMMMVVFRHRSELVAIRLRGQCDRRDLILVFEFSNDSIDRSKTYRLHLKRGFGEYFIDGQGATCVLNRIANGIKLDRVSSFGHGRSLHSALFEAGLPSPWYLSQMREGMGSRLFEPRCVFH